MPAMPSPEAGPSWVTVDAGQSEYHGLWAYSPAEGHAAFEQFIDAMIERRRRLPGMHIYHFAPYEPAALKRLMGRYAAVTRQGVRCSVESYSIKKLEEFYDFKRQEALPELGRQKRHFEAMLEQGEGAQAPQEMRDIVERYNEDDCVSTWALREWLEGIRSELVAGGTEVPRPIVEPHEESETRKERDQRKTWGGCCQRRRRASWRSGWRCGMGSRYGSGHSA